MAFYNFVRTADDIADHPNLVPQAKLDLLDELEAGLVGAHDRQPVANVLRKALADRAMPPRHALDLLTAFRMDVTKLRYANWDELIHYCSFSAMPVGRFVLDVHEESTSTWVASDALCAALQINNHLQDCAKDFRDLDRVYLPLDAMEAAGASVEMLAADRSSPQLLQCLRALAVRNEALLDDGNALAVDVRDFRLGLEISLIQGFAERIATLLRHRDPLAERVHLSAGQLAVHSARAMAGETWRRLTGSRPMSKSAAGA